MNDNDIIHEEFVDNISLNEQEMPDNDDMNDNDVIHEEFVDNISLNEQEMPASS